MKIELDGYVIETNSLAGKFSKFNLYKLNTIKEGKLAGRVMKEAIWYDTTFTNCLKTIAQHRLEEEDKLKLEDFIKRFEEVSEKLMKEIVDINDKIIDKIMKK